jgi:hypothetical protein
MILFSWIVRLLLLMFVVRLVANAIFGSRPRQARRTPPAGPAGPVERAGGTLVRDPQCGTYLPQARAIRVGSGSDAHYFCSTACRDAYRTAHSSVA